MLAQETEARLIRWTFESLTLLVIEIDGKLYCPTATLAKALSVTTRALNLLAQSHRDELESLRGSDASPKLMQLLRDHKEEFGIIRLKNDLHLWSESDMILLAVLSRAPTSKAFRRDLIQLVKDNARKEALNSIEVKVLIEREMGPVRKELYQLKELVDILKAGTDAAASAAGSLLRGQRDLKKYDN